MLSLRSWRDRVAAELDASVAFWERHSHDPLHGGFFSCLSRDGSVYDETKYVWMQGRQIWVYARLYRTRSRFRRPELLEAAREGARFLLSFAPVAPGSPRVAFALTRDGRPLKVQRTIYSETFCALGLDELGRATGEPQYLAPARRWALAVASWARGAPQELGAPDLGGSDPPVEEMLDWGAQNLLLHLQRGDSVVLENVTPQGQEVPGSGGRLMNPGHALEAGWLLLNYLGVRGVPPWGGPGLVTRIIEGLVEGPLRWGWDPQHGGGLFAFLDADGHCPTQLEWAMKLWWPHLEAMVALLVSYTHRPDPRLLQFFQRVATYAFQKFRDPEQGEWFGYLAREGSVALTIKGGPFKGLFPPPAAPPPAALRLPGPSSWRC